MRILLVEDDQDVLRCVQDFLVDQGHQVVVSGAASEAANTISVDPAIEVLITDFNLGEALDGSDLAHQFRRKHPDSRVIMMSGRPDLARKKIDGLDNFKLLDKPFRLTELIDAIAA